MGQIQFPIIKGDRVLDNGDYGDSIPINMVAIAREIKGAAGYLLSHDGLTLAYAGQGVDRGSIYNERWGRSFRVSGQKLIEITGGGVVVIGDVLGSARCRFAYSFQSIMIVSSGNVYRYNGTTLTLMTDPDFGSPVDVWWADQYYMFTDGANLYHTEVNDETAINPTNYDTSEISPDPTKGGGRTQDNLVVAFNRYTTEYFINQANPQFAYSRINQKAVNVGIVSTGGWIEIKGRIYLLGGEKGERASIYLLGAGQAESISTRYIDGIIAGYSEAELSTAWLESRVDMQDKILYVQLPDHVFAFNIGIAEKLGKDVAWTEIRSPSDTPWRACNGVYDVNLNGWYYGDKLGTNIGLLDSTTAGHYGQPVTSQWETPLVPMEGLSVMELEINNISGYGSADTAIFVSRTLDGITHDMEWSRYVSMHLNYSMRYIVRLLGYVRKQIAFKFRTLNTEKINVSGLVIEHDGPG